MEAGPNPFSYHRFSFIHPMGSLYRRSLPVSVSFNTVRGGLLVEGEGGGGGTAILEGWHD